MKYRLKLTESELNVLIQTVDGSSFPGRLSKEINRLRKKLYKVKMTANQKEDDPSE